MTTAHILRYGCAVTIEKIVEHMVHNVSHGTSPQKCDVLIRFGNISDCDRKMAYNGAEQIEDSATKTTARKLFASDSVMMPPTVIMGKLGARFIGPHTSKTWTGKWIHRPAEHSGGASFTIVDTPKKAKELLYSGGYLQRIIEKDAEFRVHCAHGRVQHVSKKPVMLNGGESNTDSWARVLPSKCDIKMLKLALAATDAIDLDFAAVDIIRGVDGKFYVLETNTGPSIPGDRCPRRYANYFDWLIAGFPIRRKHLPWRNLPKFALFKTPW